MGLSTSVLLTIALAPLLGALVAGFVSPFLGRAGRAVAHTVTIACMIVSVALSFQVLYQLTVGGADNYNQNIYTWFQVGQVNASIGFMVDRLTAMMLVVVGFVSLVVHLYTIGYMRDDPGYTRFFSYISLFTFSMFMLVMSNNFLQLFFGWEAVGLVSYLLIGFWYKRPTAIYANFKAFMVNRVGDFGFLLGIAAVLTFLHTLDYASAFSAAPGLAGQALQITANTQWDAATVICILLFVGAMGKSAQVPLHVWLPDSMEGPTPISALIHAATMVTAGIFMVARMSPLFELSDAALSFVLVIGAITALFMGLVGIVQNDIKRVVAYSTLSQLGYMTVALGVSAYSAGIFHLMTHAFFKALLFLGSGSVIIAMHHNQDMRWMGGLRKYMPITWITFLLGTLALVATPFFSGFYSKDSIIEATAESVLPGAGFAHFAVVAGVFVTALYSFRAYFMVFHGPERYDQNPDAHHGHDGHGHGHGGKPHETPWVVTVPLILLAIPSVVIGYPYIEPMLYGGFFGDSVQVLAAHPTMVELKEGFHGPMAMALHAVQTLPFWLTLAGFAVAYYCYMVNTALPAKAAKAFKPLYDILVNKFYMDWINENIVMRGARLLGTGLWKGADAGLIDGAVVNGSWRGIGWFAGIARWVQSGYLFHYALVMILGVLALMTYFVWLNK